MSIYDEILEFIPDEDHWCKGKSHAVLPNGEPAFCILGALGQVDLNQGGISNAQHKSIYKHIFMTVDELYPGHLSVSGFNDHPKTTYDDVRRVLETCSAV